PAGVCEPATAEVTIPVTDGPTADAGPDQTTCVGGTAALTGEFTGTTGILWSTPTNGSFDDPTLPNAVYTPGSQDITNGSVTLTMTTDGPCASISDEVIITIQEAPEVNAGNDATICSDATYVMQGSFDGSTTGLVWSAAGDRTFSDATDEFAVYTPGENDILNGSVVITATATGSCAGFTDAMMLKFNPAATVDAGSPLSACDGAPVTLSAVLGGSATSLQWTSSGDGTFDDPTLPNATYTPGDADMTNGSVTLTATTNNPPGPCAS